MRTLKLAALVAALFLVAPSTDRRIAVAEAAPVIMVPAALRVADEGVDTWRSEWP